MALLTALFLVAVLTIVIATGIAFTMSTSKVANNTGYDAESYDMARAGIEDTLDWLRRQPSQPVTNFNPQPDASDPVAGDTDDPEAIDPGGPGAGEPNLGIVREFALNPGGNLWGRYEVGKITRVYRDSKGKLTNYRILEGADPNNLTQEAIASATRNAYEGVQDASYDEGVDASGTIWRIYSQGYVYYKDPTANSYFFQGLNRVLSQTDLETEVRRIAIHDYDSAITMPDGAACTCDNTNKITLSQGDGDYFLQSDTGATPTPDPSGGGSTHTNYHNATSLRTTPSSDEPNWATALGVPDGLTFNGMADLRATQLSDLPNPIPSEALIYVRPSTGTLQFNDGTNHPLGGGGVLVVDGNLEIDNVGGTKQTFNGMIFVTGNYTQYDNSDIEGEVVVGGSVTLHQTGSGSSATILKYSHSAITTAQHILGGYRESTAALKVLK